MSKKINVQAGDFEVDVQTGVINIGTASTGNEINIGDTSLSAVLVGDPANDGVGFYTDGSSPFVISSNVTGYAAFTGIAASLAPTTGDTTQDAGVSFARDNTNLDSVGFIGYPGTKDFVVQADNYGAHFSIISTTTAGLQRNLIVADPDVGADIYHAGNIAVSTDVAGIYSPLGSAYLEEKATPGADTLTRGQLWVRNDNPQTLMFTDGDSTDFVVAGGLLSGVSSTGSPVNNQVAVWTDATTIEGDAGLTYTGGTLTTTTFSGALSGNATTATALATGRTISQTGDVTWTSSSFDGTGNISDAATIANDAVTYAKMQNVAANNVFLGNNAGAGGIVDELTGNEATALLSTFATGATTQGVVPGSNSLGATYYLDGSGAWSVPAGGDVSKVGTPVNNQVGVWTGDGTLEGDADLTYDGTTLTANDSDVFISGIGSLFIEEASGAGTDKANSGQIWIRDDAPNKLMYTDDTGQDIQISPYRATVQTTDASLTPIIDVPVASGTGFGFRINIIGTQDATGDTVFESVFGAIRNQGGTTALVGSTITDRTDDAGATTWVITVSADDTGDNLAVEVTGEAAHTIDWKVNVEILDV